jgi:hypothetical protein
VFIAVVYFITDSVRKLLDTPSYNKISLTFVYLTTYKTRFNLISAMYWLEIRSDVTTYWLVRPTAYLRGCDIIMEHQQINE